MKANVLFLVEEDDIFTSLINAVKPQPNRNSVQLQQQTPASTTDSDLHDMIKEQHDRAKKKAESEVAAAPVVEKVKVWAQVCLEAVRSTAIYADSIGQYK